MYRFFEMIRRMFTAVEAADTMPNYIKILQSIADDSKL
jgi:hypothetical protein